MINFKKVFPRLKETYETDGIAITYSNDGKQSNMTLSYEDSPVMKPFAENLIISYAIDKGTNYEYIPNRDLSEDVTIEKLHEAALENMIDEIGNNIQAHGDAKDVLMITNGGNYEAAMLIWDEIWPEIEKMVGDKLYIAIPARDILYVAPKSNPNSIGRLTELIHKMFNLEDAQGLMVKHIYEQTKDGWKVVATA